MLGKFLLDLLVEFLLTHLFLGTDKGPGQHASVLDQVGHVEYQRAARWVLPCITSRPCGMPSTYKLVTTKP